MLSRLLAPVHSIDLQSIRLAGRFASPEGEGSGDGKPGGGDGGKPADGGKPGEGEGKKGDGGEGGGKPADTPGRISVLVEERNTAQQEAATHRATAERLQRELDQLKANDQTQVIKDLQKQLSDSQSATKTRFDKLLETELANLPDAAQKAVKAIPGGSEAQFDWLVANRAILQPETKPEDKKPAGPTHDKKPPKGEDAGASSVAKSYVESRKPKTSGFPGLTG